MTEVQNKNGITFDIDAIATDLNGKADKDLANATAVHIVETYSSGTDWYRVYSDGWCEQGGQVTTSNNSYTITLLKPFRDTNYCVTTTPNHSGIDDGYNSFCYKSSGSQLVIYNKEYGTSVNTAVIWEAKGYIGGSN